MRIRELYIKNFRGFEEERFSFNPSFTVAIGDNGTGKSTLIQALQVAVGAFFNELPYQKQRNIKKEEIRFGFNKVSKNAEYHTPTIVEATGTLDKSGEITWRRVIPEYGKPTSSNNADMGSIKNIARTFYLDPNWKITTHVRQKWPVIAYFGVKQLASSVSNRRQVTKVRDIIRDGYKNAFEDKSDEAAFVQWFHYYQENLANGGEFDGTYTAVINAIETAIPYLKNITFDNFRLELVADCEIDGQKNKRLPHSLMSDGLKRMLGIVADIAYRCAILNGSLGEKSVMESNGVVMIDELDMHLHPNWQRHVVSDLKKAFPNIQFVVTTHSPFIIQSLQSDELINLDRITDFSTNDLKIDEVATLVMGVESPYAIDNEDKYNHAKKILNLLETNTSSNEITNEIASISDPGLRAFLELNKMAKGK